MLEYTGSVAPLLDPEAPGPGLGWRDVPSIEDPPGECELRREREERESSVPRCWLVWCVCAISARVSQGRRGGAVDQALATLQVELDSIGQWELQSDGAWV